MWFQGSGIGETALQVAEGRGQVSSAAQQLVECGRAHGLGRITTSSTRPKRAKT